MTRRRAEVAAARADAPQSVADVVAELVVEFVDGTDWPAGHHCVRGEGGCSHEAGSRLPLLERVRLLTRRGQHARDESAAPRRYGPAGSPAPWAAGPVEFLDEVYRQALRYSSALRDELGLSVLHVHRKWVEGKDPSGDVRVRAVTTTASLTPIDLAGPAALRDLPGLLDIAAEVASSSPLVRGPMVTPGRPERGYRAGEVDRALRAWRDHARQLTGHAPHRPVLRMAANPLSGLALPGPTCEDGWSCGHRSCRRLWLTTLPEWTTVRCPWCGASGFRVDERRGVAYCNRPGCTDDTGARPEWSVAEFSRETDELRLTEEEERVCRRRRRHVG